MKHIWRDKHTTQSVLKDGGYNCTSNHIAEDKRLTGLEYAVCEYILHKPDNWYIRKCEIQKRFNEGKVDFGRAWKNLQEYGYLTGVGKGTGKVWTFYETPIGSYMTI